MSKSLKERNLKNPLKVAKRETLTDQKMRRVTRARSRLLIGSQAHYKKSQSDPSTKNLIFGSSVFSILQLCKSLTAPTLINPYQNALFSFKNGINFVNCAKIWQNFSLLIIVCSYLGFGELYQNRRKFIWMEWNK